MNLNISNQYIGLATMLGESLHGDKTKYQNTHTYTHTEMYARTYTSPHGAYSKLSVSVKTHSAVLTPRLGAHTTIPLACQGWKLYSRVIPAALRMVGNKACRNEWETDREWR